MERTTFFVFIHLDGMRGSIKLENLPVGQQVVLIKGQSSRPEGLMGVVEMHEYDATYDRTIVWIKWPELNTADPFFEPLESDEINPFDSLEIL